MRRRLLNLLTALSLLLCATVCVVWVASGTHFRSVAYNMAPDAVYSLGVMRGRALLSVVRRPWGTSAGSSLKWSSLPLSYGPMPGWESFHPPQWHGSLGFLYSEAHQIGPSYYHYYGLVVPLWCPAVLSAVLPALCAFALLRRQGRRTNRCASCGYDLRAAPDRCPECGTTP